MHVDPQTEKLGVRWLIGAGGFALVLAYSLYTVDNRLQASKGEEHRKEMLSELRTAQASLSSRATDPRQTQDGVFKLRAVPVNAESSTADDHGSEEHN